MALLPMLPLPDSSVPSLVLPAVVFGAVGSINPESLLMDLPYPPPRENPQGIEVIPQTVRSKGSDPWSDGLWCYMPIPTRKCTVAMPASFQVAETGANREESY